MTWLKYLTYLLMCDDEESFKVWNGWGVDFKLARVKSYVERVVV